MNVIRASNIRWTDFFELPTCHIETPFILILDKYSIYAVGIDSLYSINGEKMNGQIVNHSVVIVNKIHPYHGKRVLLLNKEGQIEI